MTQQLEQRLTALKSELEAGQKMLSELENKQTNLRNSMLRIRAAIKVLEEELATEKVKEQNKSKFLG